MPSEFYTLFNSFDSLTKDRTIHDMIEELKGMRSKAGASKTSESRSLGPVRLLNGSWESPLKVDGDDNDNVYDGTITGPPKKKRRTGDNGGVKDKDSEDTITISLPGNDFKKIMYKLNRKNNAGSHSK
jgi:hypothetical protein